ncbi:MAG: hypothetical protein IKX78_02210, partial [Clostridia bacterium]|nr:hypothetical protein [Clostridia bacterium]
DDYCWQKQRGAEPDLYVRELRGRISPELAPCCTIYKLSVTCKPGSSPTVQSAQNPTFHGCAKRALRRDILGTLNYACAFDANFTIAFFALLADNENRKTVNRDLRELFRNRTMSQTVTFHELRNMDV